MDDRASSSISADPVDDSVVTKLLPSKEDLLINNVTKPFDLSGDPFLEILDVPTAIDVKVEDFAGGGDDGDEERRIADLLEQQMQDAVVIRDDDAVVLCYTGGVSRELSAAENEFLSGHAETVAYGLDLEFDVEDEHRHG